MNTRDCPKCGKKMIQRYEHIVLTTNPPQHPWFWWCTCGNTENGGIKTEKTEEELYQEMWEIANAKERD